LTTADVNAALTAPGAIPVTTNPPLGDASTRIATTLFVDGSVADLQSWVEQQNFAFRQDLTLYAPLASPQFSGIPTAPTAAPGVSTGQLATTAYVMAAVSASTAGVVSFNTRTGVVDLLDTDITNAGGALLASPVFSGTPQAPTATIGTDTGQLATCAFVLAELGGASIGVMTFNTRAGAVVLTAADITGAGGALSASPALTGTPTAPTASSGTATQQLATTAFVTSAIAALSTGVSSFNSRTGAITLTANDISAAGGALLASPIFSGQPTAPTASPGTSTTQLATTAFVMAAISAANVVSSFNGRAGAVTLTGADITGLGNITVNGLLTATTVTANGALKTVGGEIYATGAITGGIISPHGAGLYSETGGGFVTGFFSDDSGGQYTRFVGPTSIVATITHPAGSLTIPGSAYKPGGGAWLDSSDARIKRVGTPYATGLATIERIDPVNYTYLGNDTMSAPEPGRSVPYKDSNHYNAAVSHQQFIGLVAQQVEAVMPELVTLTSGYIDGKKVEDLRTLDPTPLLYALVNAVKELSSRVVALETVRRTA
jgi:hypothetical protein